MKERKRMIIDITYELEDEDTEREHIVYEVEDWTKKYPDLYDKEEMKDGLTQEFMSKHNLTINVKFKTENPNFNVVAQAIDSALRNILTFTRIVSLKINPNEKTIQLHPNAELNFDKLSSSDAVKTYLDIEKAKGKKIEHFAYAFVEHSMDFWGRFGTTEFVLFGEISDMQPHFEEVIRLQKEGKESEYQLSVRPDPLHLQIYCFPSCNELREGNLKTYIKTEVNGYKLEGDFWERDWLKDQYKRPATGGGKK